MVLLEVSLGEAVDKLTILAIKLEKIKDERKNDVKKEYDIIANELKEYLPKLEHYYKQLYEINLVIWNLQDEIRDTKRDNTYIDKCLLILDENDRRFRVKNKINYIGKSLLKEQKGYKKKKAIFFGHFGLGDMINTVGAVRYLSTVYDELIVVVKEPFGKYAKTMYEDDETIQIFEMKDDPQPYIKSRQLAQNYKDTHRVLLTGYNKNYISQGEFANIPLNFYNDLKLHPNVYRDYFHINIPDSSKQLLDYLKSSYQGKYIFVHELCSVSCYYSMIDVNSTDLICINPDRNMYVYEDVYLVENKMGLLFQQEYHDCFDILVVYKGDQTCDISVNASNLEKWNNYQLSISLQDDKTGEQEIIDLGTKIDPKQLKNYKTKIKLNKSETPIKIDKIGDKMIRHPVFIKNKIEILSHGFFPDTFDINCVFVNENTMNIKIRRTDKQEGWGLNLQFYLFSVDMKTSELITVGPGRSLVKNYKTKIQLQPYSDNPLSSLYKQIASNFVGKPFLDYTDLIKEAEELYIIDSCYACVAALSSPISKKKVIYPRNKNLNYPFCFDKSWNYDYSQFL